MKKYLLVFVVCLIILTSYLLIKNENSFKEVCTQEKVCFQIHIADNKVERTKGLSVFDSLPENEGMLFIFEKSGDYSFWMKDMKFPIDIIWLDENRRIVHIEKSLSPCSESDCQTYTPKEKAKYVLEINAGLTETHNINLGDFLEFK